MGCKDKVQQNPALMHCKIYFRYADETSQLFNYTWLAAWLEQHLLHDESVAPNDLPFFWALERTENLPLLKAYMEAAAQTHSDRNAVILAIYYIW